MMGQFKSHTDRAAGMLKSVAASVGGKKDLPVTRIVDAVLENKPAEMDMRLLDPTIQKGAAGGAGVPQKAFREAIVFVVGSGNYVEYQNLQDYSRRPASSGTKNVIYGTTELVSANEFLRQLNVLGSRQFGF
eukprot:Tamp_36481.p1 GENE.Tamp_36481~~Tamp_36481.p1  ORF type:complete len:132 (+),score=21.61 Tamp_36481:3-398(+)